MSPNVKSAALQIMTSSGVANLFRPLTRSAAVVFMLHRFADPRLGISGHDPVSVRALLAYLRREKHQLVDLTTLLTSLRGEAAPLRHAVAFTIDDGYHEHASVAAPLFAEFDCPVTTFVTTGFVDGALWFWWDKIEYLFTRTQLASVAVTFDDVDLRYDLNTSPDVRRIAIRDFTSRCKSVSESRRTDAIERLSAAAELPLPARAPRMYAAMTWGELRHAEDRGMSFGPHTVSHPFVSRVSEERAREEIFGSWARLRAEAARPVPIFAYPNGRPGDFGEREFRLLADAGITAAVTAVEGFATREQLEAPNGCYLLPRIAFPDSLPDLIQQVDGLERFKSLLRGVDAGSLIQPTA